MSNRLREIEALGQSIWIDNISGFCGELYLDRDPAVVR